MNAIDQERIGIHTAEVTLIGDLHVPRAAQGIVLFAHGSGSGRKSGRNRGVASVLRQAGFGTLLFDLLTRHEDEVEDLRFDIPLLSARLAGATRWVHAQPHLEDLPIGLFGASTGAASALNTAAALPQLVNAVVSRGGRPDLAMAALPLVKAPTLLIVGGLDEDVVDLNREALDALTCPKDLVIVPDATHLFEEPGALEQVARLAAGWFARHLIA
ncbi:MAG: dienelactone hydrolase family protein [Flavobacteriales bacterium]|nr:dienelactone hydrolase family protein [Flavobacteriales bacterium]